ncbi:type II secretion system protein [Isosphaeraceae bacterium EP7]
MRVSDPRRRAGFTLIELMVVILILGVLIALLLPAINGAVKTARDATVTAEINQIATALADFKSKYNKYPPSRLILREDGIYDTSVNTALSSVPATAWVGGAETFPAVVGDLTYGELATRSLKFLKSNWPRAFFVEGTPSATAAQQHDFNGNGTYEQGSIYLEGHECLVFFLGGIPIAQTLGGPGVSGFANSPTKPFVNSSLATNRTAPMMEFRVSRLVDNEGDGMYGYVDPLGTSPDVRYYAYFSGTGGGYDPNDVNFVVTTGANGMNELDALDTYESGARTYKVGFRTALISSTAPNPYTTSLPTATPTTNYVNPDSYQLISAGRDGLYGLGGQYSPNEPSTKLPGDVNVNAGQRQGESDNLTNFANGHLD